MDNFIDLKTMDNFIDLKIEKNGIANLIFDLKKEKVNKLSSKVLFDLEQKLAEVRLNDDIKILVIKSHKKNNFIAGADINEIKDIKTTEEAFEKVKKGQNILDKISLLSIPTIAVIDGACLGGGLELALACKYRIVTNNEKTKLGLPEVNLGIIPGFGGTQRLPKLVGLQQSLTMILSGKAISAKKAYKIGLADAIINPKFINESLNEFIEIIRSKPKRNSYLIKRNKRKRIRFRHETLFLGKYFIYKLAKKNLLQKTKGHYPAPLTALEVIDQTYDISNDNIKKGLEIEAKYFSELAIGKTSKNLINLFFISEEIKKDKIINKNTKSKNITNIGLIGAGIMGGGIAWLFSNKKLDVRMKDISFAAISLGFKQINKIYGQLKKIGKYNDNDIALRTNKVSPTLNYQGFANRDLIVEAIIEDIKIKKNTLKEVEEKIGKDTIIASNTSSLSISQMAKSLKRPENFAGMHFFNPVNRMPLVEVIRGEKTSDQTIAAIVELAKKLGKTAIVVEDVPGFLVNRILIPYINEAAFIIEEGADLKLVDDLIVEFGMPMGPFTLADNVGIDVGYKVAKILEKGYGKRMQVCDLLETIAQDKTLLGKKSSQGFFKYDKSGKQTGTNPKINRIIAENDLTKTECFEEDVIDRCIFIMVNEAIKCLEENVVKNAKYLDMAMIMGTGFPAFRGGLLRYAHNIGIQETLKKIEYLHKKYGKRFQPAKLLINMAKNNKSFYEDNWN